MRRSFVEGKEEVGIVKFFKDDRGFGFIEPEDGGNDVFLHASALRAFGEASVGEGARIVFVAQARLGKKAREVTRIISLE